MVIREIQVSSTAGTKTFMQQGKHSARLWISGLQRQISTSFSDFFNTFSSDTLTIYKNTSFTTSVKSLNHDFLKTHIKRTSGLINTDRKKYIKNTLTIGF